MTTTMSPSAPAGAITRTRDMLPDVEIVGTFRLPDETIRLLAEMLLAKAIKDAQAAGPVYATH